MFLYTNEKTFIRQTILNLLTTVSSLFVVNYKGETLILRIPKQTKIPNNQKLGCKILLKVPTHIVMEFALQIFTTIQKHVEYLDGHIINILTLFLCIIKMKTTQKSGLLAGFFLIYTGKSSGLQYFLSLLFFQKNRNITYS